MFWALPEEVRSWQKSTKHCLKYNVLSYIIFETNFNVEQYKGLNRYELYFTYSATLEDLKGYEITKKKLQTIIKELEEEGYIEWVYKSNAKSKPSIIRNLISEKIAEEQATTTTKEKKDTKPKKPKEPKEVNPDAEYIWSLYPNKKGKDTAIKKIEGLLKIYTREQLETIVERYKRDKQGVDLQYIKNGSTFFTSGYKDYTDENYQENIKDEYDYRKLDF